METRLCLKRPGGGSGEPPHHGQSEDHVRFLMMTLAAAAKCPIPLWTKQSMNLAFSWPGNWNSYQICTILHFPHGKTSSTLPNSSPWLKIFIPVNSSNKGNKGKVGQGEECPWGVSYGRMHWGRWGNISMLGRIGGNLEMRSREEHNCFSLTSTGHEAQQIQSSLGLANLL